MKAPWEGLVREQSRASSPGIEPEAGGQRPTVDAARQEEARLRAAAHGRMAVEQPAQQRRAAARASRR